MDQIRKPVKQIIILFSAKQSLRKIDLGEKFSISEECKTLLEGENYCFLSLSLSLSLSHTLMLSPLRSRTHAHALTLARTHTHSSVCLLMRSRPCGDVRCQLFQKVGNLFRANEEVGESGRERERQRMRNVDKVIESGSLRRRDILKRKR